MSLKNQVKLLFLSGIIIIVIAFILAKKHPPYTTEPRIFFTIDSYIISKDEDPEEFEKFLERIYSCQSLEKEGSEPFYVCYCNIKSYCKCKYRIKPTPACRKLIADAFNRYSYISISPTDYQEIIEGKRHLKGSFLLGLFPNDINIEFVIREGIPLKYILIIGFITIFTSLFYYVRVKKLDQNLIECYLYLASASDNKEKISIILNQLVPILVKQKEYEKAFKLINRAKELEGIGYIIDYSENIEKRMDKIEKYIIVECDIYEKMGKYIMAFREIAYPLQILSSKISNPRSSRIFMRLLLEFIRLTKNFLLKVKFYRDRVYFDQIWNEYEDCVGIAFSFYNNDKRLYEKNKYAEAIYWKEICKFIINNKKIQRKIRRYISIEKFVCFQLNKAYDNFTSVGAEADAKEVKEMLESLQKQQKKES
jgi:hypothetical protein